MPSEFAFPERIKFTQAGTVRAYFLRSILKFDMPTATPRFRRSCTQVIAALFLSAFALFAPFSANAQTILGATNKVGFAKPIEVCMESEGAVRLTVIRSDGMRGPFSVDVGLLSDTNKAVAPSFKGTNLVFADYQLASSFTLPIVSNSSTNTNGPISKVLLFVTNAVSLAGAPVILDPATSKMELDVYDDDIKYQINFDKVNNKGDEGGNITFTVKLNPGPTDPADLANISVDYAITTASGVQLAAGAAGADPATDIDPTFPLNGTISFADGATVTLSVPIPEDRLLEFDEEFIVQLSNPKGDTANPASTNNPPDRVSYAINQQSYARGHINYNSNPQTTPQPAGSVDQNFNPDNVPPLQLRHPGANGPVTALAIDFARTNYYVAGNFTAFDAVTRYGLVRLTSTGTVDTAFVPAENLNGPVSTVDFYKNGQLAGDVVLGGGFSSVDGQSRNSVARYLPTGALDQGFQIGLGANGPVYIVKAEGDNSTLVAGSFTSFDGVPRGGIARLLPNGQLDQSSFNDVGANGTIFDLSIEVPPAFTMSNSRDGSTNSVSDAQTVDSNVGAIELTYNNLGFTNNWVITFGSSTVFFKNLTNNFTLVTNQTDQTVTTNWTPVTVRLDLPRQAQSQNLLTIKVTPVPFGPENAASWSYSALVTPLGTKSVAIVGDFTSFNQVPVSRVVKTDASGAVDQTFASNIGTGVSGQVLAIDRDDTTGSYVIGGTFGAFNSNPVGNIARLTSDGVFDSSFAAGSGTDGTIRDIFIEKPDRTSDASRLGKIYIGGEFLKFNGSRRIFLARLDQGGYLDTTFMDSAFNQFAGFPSVSGVAPDGVISAITVGRNPDPVVGGIFDLVGGGAGRTATKPRQNLARLVGGETPGPGNLTATQSIFGGDENGDFLLANYEIINQSANPPIGNGLVVIKTVDESATAGKDYQSLNFITNIVSGVTNYFLAIPVIDDKIIEGDEDFQITIPDLLGKVSLGGEPVYPELAYGPIVTSTGRIVDNDVPPAVFSFAKPEYNTDENSGSASIEIYRTGNANNRVSVQFSALSSTNANSALSPDDFTAVTNQFVTFPSGVTNAFVSVPIRDDLIVESDETVMLSLSAPSAASIIDTNATTAVLNIIDNDLPAGKIDFSFAGFTVTEGQTNAVVTAVRTGGNVGLIYVDYQTSDGTATNGLDYVARSGRLTWNDRDISTRTILIPIIDDSNVESPENFTVSLVGGSQPGVIGTRHPSTVVTINDNDFYGSLAFSAPQYFADENGVSATIEVVRLNGHAGSVSVNYATSPGTNAATAAIPGTDYSNVSGTLNFGPDETAKSFTIPIIDDAIPDGPRVVRIALSAPVNASLGTNSNVNLTIIDNETVNIPAGGTDTDFVTSDGADGSVNVVAIQHEDATNANRKILIAGDFSLYNHLARSRIARLNNDGTLDRNYAVTTTIDGSIRALMVQPDGKVVIGGHFAQVDGTSSKFLSRLDVVGKRDTSFQPGAGPDNAVFALAQTYIGDPTNNLFRILIGGDFVNYNSKSRQRIARINPDGTLDPNFDPGTGPNGSVFAIAVQRDQKVLIGGDFLTVAGIPRAHIARLNSDGSLDASFDPGDGFDDTVHSIVVQADDRILVGGNFKNYNTVSRHGVIRLNMDGSNDSSFDPGTGADGIVNTIVVQPDASILVGGNFQTFGGDPRPNLVRLLPDGSVDLSINFGRGPNSVVDSIAIQSDRGIVIGGDFTEVDGLPRNRVARIYGGSISGSGAIEFAAPVYPVQESAGFVTLEVRRTGGLSGTISATYQTTGITATPGADYVETNNIVTFQPGETYKTINVQILDDFIPEPNEEVSVSLSNPVGGAIGRQPATTIEIISDDTQISFASDTYVVNENAPGSRANISIVRQGTATKSFSVQFTTGDGTATAGQDYTAVSQTVTFNPGETVKFVSVPITDDTIVEGDETVRLQLTLLNPSPDVNLGASAATLTIVDNDTAPGTLEFAGPVSVDESAGTATLTVTRSGGKLGSVTVQYATHDGTAVSPLDYTATSGSLTFQQTDTTKTITVPINDDSEIEGNESFTVTLSNPTGGAVLGQKAIINVVIIDNDFGPGSLDQSFDIGDGATGGPVYDLALQGDGNIIVGGDFTDFNNTGHPRLARLLPSGTVDSNFSSGSGPSEAVYAVGTADGNRVIAGGAFRSFNSLDRSYFVWLTASGAPDPFTSSPGLNAAVRTLFTQTNQNVLIGGTFTSPANHAGRVLLSGQFDVSFNVGLGADGDVLDTKALNDGKALVAGAFTHFGGLPRGHVARLLANGLIDPAFDTSVGANGPINAILPLADGRVVLAGDFSSFNGTSVGRIVALNTDGTIATNFLSDAGADGPIYALALQGNHILVGGDFSNYQDQPRKRIARLVINDPNFNDGTLDDTFKPGLGPDGAIYDIEIQSDQRILIAGAFQNVNGFPRAGVARLNSFKPAQDITIGGASINASDLQFTVATEPGVTYNVEYTTDFVTWNVAKTIIATGNSESVTVPLNEANYRFFRVTRTSP